MMFLWPASLKSSRTVFHTALVLAILSFLQSQSLFAQSADPTSHPKIDLISTERQSELYHRLEKQADYLERQAAVVKTVAQLIGPTVVHIETDVSDESAFRSGGSATVEEAGSGVVIQYDNRFYVLTNRHLFRDAPPEMIRIQLADRRWIRPQRIWSDPQTDVAIFLVDAPGLVAARLGNSDQMQVGDFVLAAGSPFGLSRSVTFGIISAKNRHDLQLGSAKVKFQNFLQTDAAINPGNSGGPLVNLRGEVIGINTAIASNSGGNEGIGFAIPINMAIKFARQLVEEGQVKRGFLGVTIDSRFGPAVAAELGLPRAVGARITGVVEGSPAETAGFKINDVVLRFNEIPIEDGGHLINLIGLCEIDEPVKIAVFRDRKPITLETVLGQSDQFAIPEK